MFPIVLRAWRTGDRDALDRLIPLVYRELHLMASRLMARERHNTAIQTTGLVNEAYLKLVGHHEIDWQGRAHFFAIASQMMRRVILDAARPRLREKRGGCAVQVSIEDVSVAGHDAVSDPLDVLAVDRALRELERHDRDQAKIVELRYFGGLTIEETSAVLGISTGTVKREWVLAKGWLHRELTGGPTSAGEV
jgi:RNA polymerase sigma factor (TIGR02999 family)